MSAAQFKTMFQGCGWDQHNAQELVVAHRINSMAVLRMVTPDGPGWQDRKCHQEARWRANVGLQVTETAEHGLIWLGIIARNAHRVSRTLTPAQLKNAFTDVNKYNVHPSAGRVMEECPGPKVV